VTSIRQLAAAVALLALSGCATFGRPAATFQLQCNVPEAVLLIDDMLVGRASDWAPPGKQIRPGFHRVEVRHPGYFSYFTEIQLADGGGVLVKAELHPLLD
jgi:hypothetical protein